MTEPSHPGGPGREREPFDLDAPARLIEELRAHDDVDVVVPPAVDAVILAEARERLSSRVVRLPGGRAGLAAGRWAAAAAAAVFGVCLWIWWPQPEPVPVIADPADVDGSGSVDILDAFAIARWIESARSNGDVRLDYNSDGVVDHEDVNALVALVVRVEPPRKVTR